MDSCMKKLLLILTCLFLYTPCFGKWEKIGETSRGNMYLNFESITIDQGYIYYSEMRDIFLQNTSGSKSGITNKVGDCNLFRYKILSDRFYEHFMGKGKILSSSDTPDKEWRYPRTGTLNEQILNFICQEFMN